MKRLHYLDRVECEVVKVEELFLNEMVLGISSLYSPQKDRRNEWVLEISSLYLPQEGSENKESLTNIIELIESDLHYLDRVECEVIKIEELILNERAL